MNLKHTPGPWTIVYSGVNGRCIYADGKHIATSLLYSKDGGDKNAFLIAAAPELLAVLREVTKLASDLKPVCDCGGEQTGSPEQSGRHNADCAIGIILDARAAIAKAVQS